MPAESDKEKKVEEVPFEKAKPTKKGDEKAKAKETLQMMMTKKKEKLHLKEDFKYIVRIANTDIDGTRSLVYALTGIKGMGVRTAEIVVNKLGLPKTELIGNLSDEQIDEIEELVEDLKNIAPWWVMNRQHDWEIGESYHIVSADLDASRRDDINLMKMIRCYKGIRHELGQKVRGQRTKSRGRTGLTVGVTKGAIKAAQAAAASAERKEREKKVKT